MPAWPKSNDVDPLAAAGTSCRRAERRTPALTRAPALSPAPGEDRHSRLSGWRPDRSVWPPAQCTVTGTATRETADGLPHRGSGAPEEAVSRILSPRSRGVGTHSSGAALTDALQRPTRESSLASWRENRWWAPLTPLFGLAPHGVCHAPTLADRAVGSYPTFSPLPGAGPQSLHRVVSFLWHFPSRCRGWALPSVLPPGVRTFLPACQWQAARAPASSDAVVIVHPQVAPCSPVRRRYCPRRPPRRRRTVRAGGDGSRLRGS